MNGRRTDHRLPLLLLAAAVFFALAMVAASLFGWWANHALRRSGAADAGSASIEMAEIYGALAVTGLLTYGVWRWCKPKRGEDAARAVNLGAGIGIALGVLLALWKIIQPRADMLAPTLLIIGGLSLFRWRSVWVAGLLCAICVLAFGLTLGALLADWHGEGPKGVAMLLLFATGAFGLLRAWKAAMYLR